MKKAFCDHCQKEEEEDFFLNKTQDEISGIDYELCDECFTELRSIQKKQTSEIIAWFKVNEKI